MRSLLVSEGRWISSAVSNPVQFTARTLGFRQFSFHHAARVSTGVQLGGFTPY
jgi:hypothetical protein